MSPGKGLIQRLLPEYVGENVFIGASTMSKVELRRRYVNGIDALMWGTDYPHPEGSWPNTKPRLETDFQQIPIEETRLLLGLNVKCYDLDEAALRGFADEVGPTPEHHQDPARTDPNAIREARWWFEDYGSPGRYASHRRGRPHRPLEQPDLLRVLTRRPSESARLPQRALVIGAGIAGLRCPFLLEQGGATIFGLSTRAAASWPDGDLAGWTPAARPGSITVLSSSRPAATFFVDGRIGCRGWAWSSGRRVWATRMGFHGSGERGHNLAVQVARCRRQHRSRTRHPDSHSGTNWQRGPSMP